MNASYFEKCSHAAVERERSCNLIGTLSEKTVHYTLKQYLSGDTSCQEIKIGPYYADVCLQGHIYEIQTRQFGNLREKLAAFLPEHKVTVVYPVSICNYLRWIDTVTGEVSVPKKSPRHANPMQVFSELYRIRPFLSHPNFSLKIICMETEEYRILDGYGKQKKSKATKFDKLPLTLTGEYDIEQPLDYMMLLPSDLPDCFLAKDLAKKAKISLSTSRSALLLLTELGVVRRTGKQGNSYQYEFTL